MPLHRWLHCISAALLCGQSFAAEICADGNQTSEFTIEIREGTLESTEQSGATNLSTVAAGAVFLCGARGQAVVYGIRHSRRPLYVMSTAMGLHGSGLQLIASLPMGSSRLGICIPSGVPLRPDIVYPLHLMPLAPEGTSAETCAYRNHIPLQAGAWQNIAREGANVIQARLHLK